MKQLNIPTTDEDFYYQYITIIAPIFQLQHSADINLLAKLCTWADCEGRVTLSTAKRRVLCEELKVSTTNLSKYIKRLKDRETITGEKGDYTVSEKIYPLGGLTNPPLQYTLSINFTKK